MAYTDRETFIREHVVKLRLNENEAALIDAWVKYSGQQKAVLLREMLLEQARLDMGMQFEGNTSAVEDAAAVPRQVRLKY